MKNKFGRILISLMLLGGFFTVVFAQTPDGGASNIFNGAGARQLGLGGAVVAYPQDPTTIFWNPAGMEYLQQKSASLYYASYLAGASYNFAGYVHPTLNIGTFGIGVSRIGVGEIDRTDFTSKILGQFSSEQSEFYLSYAKIIRNLFSFGLNFKLERQVIDNLSDVGFGVDLSLMYLPEFDNFVTRDLRVGLTVQNAYSPRINPGDRIDFIPHRILFGLAKPISFGESQKPLYLLFAVEDDANEAMKFRTGLEFNYRNVGMLRVGYNEIDNLTFGAGAVFRQFHLDYAYSSFSKAEFATSHRISFTVEFGKTRTELLEIVNARRQREINERAALQLEKERRDNIKRFLQEGNQLFADGNYFEAKVKYRQVLDLDPSNLEADTKIDECDTLIREQQQQALQQALEKGFEDREREALKATIQGHLDQGNAYMSDGKYDQAIAEFQAALEKLPQDESSLSMKKSIESSIAQARTGFSRRIEDIITRADKLANQNRIADAIQLLNQARGLSLNNRDKYDQITRRISQLQTKLNAMDYYTTGLIAYRDKKWKTARENFERAKQLSPNDPEILRFYVESERREKAKNMPFTPDVQRRFYEALNLYAVGKYQAAIDIYEELLEIQPYNKRIWDSLDRAREELKKQQRE